MSCTHDGTLATFALVYLQLQLGIIVTSYCFSYQQLRYQRISSEMFSLSKLLLQVSNVRLGVNRKKITCNEFAGHYLHLYYLFSSSRLLNLYGSADPFDIAYSIYNSSTSSIRLSPRAFFFCFLYRRSSAMMSWSSTDVLFWTHWATFCGGGHPKFHFS